jgi:hypothetical protein
MWVAWELVGEEGLRKSRLPRGRWPPGRPPCLGGEKKSTRAPTRGGGEGVCSPHIFGAGWLCRWFGVRLWMKVYTVAVGGVEEVVQGW